MKPYFWILLLTIIFAVGYNAEFIAHVAIGYSIHKDWQAAIIHAGHMTKD